MADTMNLKQTIRDYTMVIVRESQDPLPRYLAAYREVPLCLAEGETADAARADLEMMIEPYLQRLAADGVPVPAPAAHANARGDVMIRIVGLLAGMPAMESQSGTSAAGSTVMFPPGELIPAY